MRDDQTTSPKTPSPKVKTSVTELQNEIGFVTQRMTDEELAMLAHSDASLHELTNPEAEDLWATTKMSSDTSHLLALSNPNIVPDDDHMATTKMTREESRLIRGLEIKEERSPTRSQMITPHDRPSALRQDPPAPKTWALWTGLAILSAISLVALLVYLAIG